MGAVPGLSLDNLYPCSLCYIQLYVYYFDKVHLFPGNWCDQTDSLFPNRPHLSLVNLNIEHYNERIAKYFFHVTYSMLEISQNLKSDNLNLLA